MGKCLVLLLFWLNLPVHNCANVAETFYPYGPENGDSYGCPNDDQPYGPITVENGFPFFGEVYDQIYVRIKYFYFADIYMTIILY